jgi:hypothetical protein
LSNNFNSVLTISLYYKCARARDESLPFLEQRCSVVKLRDFAINKPIKSNMKRDNRARKSPSSQVNAKGVFNSWVDNWKIGMKTITRALQ